MADPDRYGFKRLEIHRLSHALAVRIDQMTKRLPGFELFEEGQQVRRSAKSVPSQIAEGYGLRMYKAKWLLYLFQAQSSMDETLEHLALLYECGSLKDQLLYESLKAECEKVSAKIGDFIKGVVRNHSIPYWLRDAFAPPKAPKRSVAPGRSRSVEKPTAKPHATPVTEKRIENRESRIENQL